MAIITGTQQSDTLIGTPDDDTITGLAGHDVLTGGDGGDRFVYPRLSDLSVWTGSILPWHEHIADFGNHGPVVEPYEQDLLDFSALTTFLFIGDDEFSASGRNEYRFERIGDFTKLLLFDKGGDGIADRYLVLGHNSSGGFNDAPSEHPIFTNVIDSLDFFYHYEVGTDAGETIIGTDETGPGLFGGKDRMYGMGGDDRMHGKAGDDEMFGGDGNDRLDGGAGIDTLIGGAGNDTYFVESTEYEIIIEQAGEGIDHVNTTGYFNPMPDNVENMTLVGAGAYQGEGNDLANIITGSVADNWLAGGGGNDTVSGGAGDDAIFGGSGDDWIRGGTGADYLAGNEGSDKFVYYSVAEVGFAGDGTGDLIRDFASFLSGASERDRIDLHRIDANTATAADDAFFFISGAFTGTAGELRDVPGTFLVVDPDPYIPEPPFEEAVRLIEGDVDGDGVADFQLAVRQPGGIDDALSARDFFL